MTVAQAIAEALASEDGWFIAGAPHRLQYVAPSLPWQIYELVPEWGRAPSWQLIGHLHTARETLAHDFYRLLGFQWEQTMNEEALCCSDDDLH